MSVAAVRRVVCRLAPDRPPTDAELITAIAPNGTAREAAFETLVERYGPMVLGVCRRVLADAHDAEDAFQAAFLVLARKANTIHPPGAVGGWLYGVAVRTARKAKTAAARRRRREMTTTTANPGHKAGGGEEVGGELQRAELRALIDAELAALPETHRAAVVLCDLHGKTRAEAAAELARPEGTVAAWLARGRKALAARLAKRGVALPTAGLVAVATPAVVSAKLRSTAFAALVGRTVSPAALALAESVMRTLTSGTTKLAAAVFAVGALLVAVATAGAWQFGEPRPDAPPIPLAAPADPKPNAPEPVVWKETKVLELPGWLGGSVAYSADGKVLFAGGTGGNVWAYDAATWKQLWEAKGEGHFAAVAVAPDRERIARTVKDGVQFLDAATGKSGAVLEEKGSAPLAVDWFEDAQVKVDGGVPLISRRVIFGNARGYFVKTWLEWPKLSAVTASTVADGKEPADDYAVPIAVSPDGKRVVVTGPIDRDTGKNVLWAWSVGSGAANKVLDGHTAPVVSAAWSKNGQVIVTGGADGLVIVWDAAPFKEKSRLNLGGRVVGLTLTPDGKSAAAAVVSLPAELDKPAYQEDVFVWPTAAPPAKPEPISRQLASGSFTGVASVAFSPDGRSLVSGFANFAHLARGGELVGLVRVFAAPQEKPAPAAKFVSHVEFSPNGRKYVAVNGGRVEVFDSATGKRLYFVTGEAARFTDDGKKLLVMADKVMECDPDTGKTLKSHDRPKTKFAWQQVAFAPDGKRFAVHFGTHIGVYDVATGKDAVKLAYQFESATAERLIGNAVQQLLWSPDGKLFLANGVLVNRGERVGVSWWDAETGEGIRHIVPGLPAKEWVIAFDGKRVALAQNKGHISISGADNNSGPLTSCSADASVTALAFSPDGKQLAAGVRVPARPDGTGGQKTQVKVIDLGTKQVIKVFDDFESGLPVVALAFDPDGRKLLAGTGLLAPGEIPTGAAKSGEVKMFDLTAPEPPKPAAGRQWTDAAILTEHKDLVNGVAVNPDGSSFAAATDRNVTCWDAATRKKLWEYKLDGKALALAYSPDGTHLAVAGAKEVIRLDAKTGKVDQDPKEILIQFGPMRALAYNPDGTRLAGGDGYQTRVQYTSGARRDVTLGAPPKPTEPAPARPGAVAWSKDGKTLATIYPEKVKEKWVLALWGTGPGGPLEFLGAHTDPVTALAWSADGKLLVTGDEKGTVIAWNADTGKELWRRQFRGRDDTDGHINALAISPADNTVAAAMSLGSGKGPERVVLLDGKTGADVEHIMRPWSLAVTSVAWSKDGKYLVTGCGSYLGRPVAQTEKLVGEVVVWERKP